MNKTYTINFFLILLIISPFAPLESQGSLPDSCKLKIGTNLSGPTDYGAEWPFIDIMKHARTWGTQNIVWYGGGENPWDSGLADKLERDANGYPLQVPFEAPGQDTSQIFYTVWANTGAMKAGVYTCLYDGSGEIAFDFDGEMIDATQGRIRFNLNPGQDNILIMKILRSDSSNHIRNIRIYMPDIDPDNLQSPWCEAWIQKLEPFNHLRFMDWGYTNNSTMKNWEDRTKVTDYTYTQKGGIPYEWWIDLCNKKEADAWVCIPHGASPTYIDSLAILFRDKLDPNLKIYIEYTNEYWNWIFSQAHYVHDSLDQALPWPERYAPKLAEVMQRFGSHFAIGDKSRIIRVFATQHAWWDLGWRVLSQLETDGNLHMIDAVSIAGYMGVNTDSLAALGNSASAEDVLRLARALTFNPDEYPMRGWEEHAQMSRQYNKKLVFYEGGQHFTPNPFGTIQPYGQALVDAQTHPDIYSLYTDLLAHLRTLKDEEMLFMNFSFISPKSERYGTWGILQHQFDEQPPYLTIAPKYQALIDNIPNCELPTALFNESKPQIHVFPIPASDKIYVGASELNNNFKAMLSIVDLNGRTIISGINIDGALTEISVGELPPGIYFILLKTRDTFIQRKIIVQ